MSDPLTKISKEIKELSDRISDVSLIQAVDLLNDEEIDELKLLADLDDAEQTALFDRRSKNPDTLGRYKQLSDLGLINMVQYMGGNVDYFGMGIKARWAIARHDRLAERERKRRWSETMHKWLGHSFTILSAMLGVLLGWFLGRL